MALQRTISREQISQGPRIAAMMLPGFNDADLESIRRSFRFGSSCQLGQAWQAKQSERFAPALVRTGWRRNSLLVYAELADVDISTQASGFNQRLWEIGDAFEIFLRPDGDDAYFEFQISPNNQRLQLHYANTAALNRVRKTGSLAEALIAGDVFRSKTWIEDSHSRWHVFAEIPGSIVCRSNGSLAGDRWHFSFSRYDYTSGVDEPVISSTSPHAEANFHSQKEWGILNFATGSSIR